MRYYEEDETGKLIPLQEDTIPDNIQLLIDDAFEHYEAEYGEETEGVVIKDPSRHVNIVATT